MRPASLSDALSGLDAVAKIWRRRRIFAAVFAATIGIAIAALVVLPVRYLATAAVIVAEQEPGAANNVSAAAWAQKIGDPADLESQLLVIHSARLLRMVMNSPGVLDAVVQECERGHMFGSGSSCDKLKTDTGAFIDYVDGKLSVASAGRSRVINISYQSGIPEVAKTLANAVTQVFLDDQRTEGANSRELASSWLWQELKQLDNQIRAADEKIQTFRQTKGLMRGANAPITSERLSSIGQQLSQAEAARADAAARLKEIRSAQAGGLTDAPSVLSSRTIQDMKQQLTTVSAQLASAQTMLGPRHPSILALSREQSLIQQRISDEMDNIAASAQKAFDASDAQVASLKKQMDVAKVEAGSATLDEASIESMVRDTEVKRQQYAELYKKASDLETERRVLRGSTRLVSLAEVPSKPFFPKKIPFLAAGLTLALIFGAIAALLADRFSSVVRVEQQTKQDEEAVAPATVSPIIAQEPEPEPVAAQMPPAAPRVDPAASGEGPSLLAMMAGVPVLARLPWLRQQRQPLSAVGAILQGHHDLPVPQMLRFAAENGEFQQAVRQLALGLGIGQGKPVRRIAVTAPAKGAGKTATVFALAEHLVAGGHRVLLVECDLLDPAFRQILSLPSNPGLAGVLSGAIAVNDAVMRTDHPDLDVLPAGNGSQSAIGLLFGVNLAQLLAGFGSYDAVLVDSPLPTQQGQYLTDMDCTLLCVKNGRPVIEPAMAAVNRARALGAGNIAIAVTMAETGRRVSDHQAVPTNAAYARAV